MRNLIKKMENGSQNSFNFDSACFFLNPLILVLLVSKVLCIHSSIHRDKNIFLSVFGLGIQFNSEPKNVLSDTVKLSKVKLLPNRTELNTVRSNRTSKLTEYDAFK